MAVDGRTPLRAARDASADSRIIRQQDNALIVQTDWQPQAVIDAPALCFPTRQCRRRCLTTTMR
ncbi:hypothetical protein CTI14_47830, partial [Methylobacterium radiotolerans]